MDRQQHHHGIGDQQIKGKMQMKKSGKFKSVSAEELKEICNALEGEKITTAQFAMRKCVVDDISDERMISDLKELKNNGAIKIVKISSLAIAALDIWGAEKYTGTDELIRELIQTKFYSNGKKTGIGGVKWPE